MSKSSKRFNQYNKKTFTTTNLFNSIKDLPELDLKLELCSECKALGYCKMGKKVSLQNEMPGLLNNASGRFDLENYINNLPITVKAGSKMPAVTRAYVQKAYDAFYQQDYETALLNFKAAAEIGCDSFTANYTAAVVCFLMNDYEAAAMHMQHYSSSLFYTPPSGEYELFIDECSNRIVAAKEQQSKMDVAIQQLPLSNALINN